MTYRKKVLYIISSIAVLIWPKTAVGLNDVYSPSSKFFLHTGINLTIPTTKLIHVSNHREVNLSYRFNFTGGYRLLNFNKTQIGIAGGLGYQPTTVNNILSNYGGPYHKDYKSGISLQEEHCKMIAVIVFTSVKNKNFYMVTNLKLGYELDWIFNSTLSRGGQPDPTYALSRRLEHHIFFSTLDEFFYGIYLETIVTFPLTELKTPFDNSTTNDEHDYILSQARWLGTNIFEIGLSVNIISLFNPPSNKRS